MAAILFFKMSQKFFKRKHYKLIVHWKPLKPILSEIETLLPKTCMRVTATAPKNHNQSEQSDQIWVMTTPNAKYTEMESENQIIKGRRCSAVEDEKYFADKIEALF